MNKISNMSEYFRNMLIHKGEILENVVRRREPNLEAFARSMGYTSRTLRNHFLEPDLSDLIILKYAKALNYNFKEEFPELYTMWVVKEPDTEYMLNPTTQMLQNDLDRYRRLYIAALEEKANAFQEKAKVLEEKNQIALQLADCQKQLAANASQ